MQMVMLRPWLCSILSSCTSRALASHTHVEVASFVKAPFWAEATEVRIRGIANESTAKKLHIFTAQDPATDFLHGYGTEHDFLAVVTAAF